MAIDTCTALHFVTDHYCPLTQQFVGQVCVMFVYFDAGVRQSSPNVPSKKQRYVRHDPSMFALGQ